MTRRCWILVLGLAALLVGGSRVLSGTEKDANGRASFGALEAAGLDAARGQALAWLKGTGNTDEATLQKFDAIWKRGDGTVLDRVADTLALGDAQAARLLAEARDPLAPAPTEVPAVLTCSKRAVYFKANLGLAYARSLSNRRVHEEALDTLKAISPEQVVDPAAYLFHRAVCEHALLLQKEAGRTLGRLLDDAVDAPERYKTLAALMLLDMQTWKDKDLGAVARKMDNSERRLQLARGGPQTQEIQKDILRRLDELIKEKENQAKNQGQNPNSDNCPPGSSPTPGNNPSGANNPTSPLPEPAIVNAGGTGKVDPVKLRKLVERWGELPEKQRAQAIQNLTRGMPAMHREAIENYFRNIAKAPRN